MHAQQRIRGLDSIRFVLACIVTIGHTGLFPLLEGIDSSSSISKVLGACYGATINGPAAVIVFFVISGFCIHYPYRKGERLRVLRYYPRRYFRILVPLAGGIWLAHAVGYRMHLFEKSILWSIVCEEIYYLLYPFLLSSQRRIGWSALLISAFIVAAGVAWTAPAEKDYANHGWKLNWLLGLPCWLLGCVLAERSDSLYSPISSRAIWSWRFIILCTSGVLLGLRFHSPVGYPHTLNYFAILSFFWLQREIRYFRHVDPPRFTEWAGKWSYSLYLIHMPASVIYQSLLIPNLGFIINWFSKLVWVLVCSYIYYFFVEKPSHALARRLGKQDSKTSQLSQDAIIAQKEEMLVPKLAIDMRSR